jgi:ADP-glucose pyrophosphorylase
LEKLKEKVNQALAGNELKSNDEDVVSAPGEGSDVKSMDVDDQSTTPDIMKEVEKPENYVSTLINCGIYLFNSESLFDFIREELVKNSPIPSEFNK